jgi:hypothetical protein
MRNSKSIEIDDKKITVYELTVAEIIGIGETKAIKEKSTDLSDFKSVLEDYLPKALSGVTLDELIKMAPSDLKEIYDIFREVNATFFDVARSMGMGELLNQVTQAIQKDFLKLLVDSFTTDITIS